MFEAGFTIEQVALVTGHKDWRMLRRYAPLKPEALRTIRAARAAKVFMEAFPLWMPPFLRLPVGKRAPLLINQINGPCGQCFHHIVTSALRH